MQKFVDELVIIGSERQVIYARGIINRIRNNYPKARLPHVKSATFWIQFQNESPNKLWELSKDINTMFTDIFPKYDKEVAIDAINQIMKNLNNVVIVDCESTGIKKTDSMVEIGIVKFINRKPVVVYQSLIKPKNTDLEKYGRSKASQVNSITGEMLKNAPELPEIWSEILPYLHDHIITYNTWFDANLIIRSAQRYPELELPVLHTTDMMKIATVFYQSPDYLSLDELVQRLHMRISKNSRHRAADDALICGRALVKLYNTTRIGV